MSYVQQSGGVASIISPSQPALNLDVGAPAVGSAALRVDSNTREASLTDDRGYRHGRVNNQATVAQTPAATVRTYLAGSAIAIPRGGLQIGTTFRWRIHATKTAAGTAASTIDIAVGTAGTTADTARVSFTKPAGTAVADDAWFEIVCVCRGPLSASGVFAGTMIMVHNLSATGHATIPCVVVNTISGAFDVTVPNLIVGLCITTGASDAITIQQVDAEAVNL